MKRRTRKNDPRVQEILLICIDVVKHQLIQHQNIVGVELIAEMIGGSHGMFDAWPPAAVLSVVEAWLAVAPEDDIASALVDARLIMVDWARCERHNAREALEAAQKQVDAIRRSASLSSPARAS